MEEKKLSNRNLAFFTAKESIYVAVVPVLWGAIMQQFLLQRGVSNFYVGLHSSLVSAVYMIATMLCAGLSERTTSPLKHCTRFMLALALLTAAYLPITFWDLGPGLTMVLASLLTVVLHFLHSCKYIYDYRINYQIIEPHRYGTMVFLSSAFTGVGGVAFSWLFSYMIDHNTGGNPYFICMVLTVALLLLTVVLNGRIKAIYPLPPVKTQRKNPIQQLREIFHEESFQKLLIPNILRGVTLSLTGCIVLIAAVMGIDESGRAKIPLVTALATALASVVYMVLSKFLSVGAINIVGGVLTCSLIFLPWGNTLGFLIVMFLGFLGRIIVDNAVPTMLFPVIDPKIAGSYNAWRCVLYGACSIVVTPIISGLLDVVHPLWLLIPGTVTYLGVTVWYYIVCRKLKNAVTNTESPLS
jgi:hypothetical protein